MIIVDEIVEIDVRELDWIEAGPWRYFAAARAVVDEDGDDKVGAADVCSYADVAPGGCALDVELAADAVDTC